MQEFFENRVEILYQMSVPIEEAFNKVQDAMAIAAANKEFLLLEMLSTAFSDLKRTLDLSNNLMEMAMDAVDKERGKNETKS